MKLIRTRIADEIEKRSDGQVIWSNDPEQLRHAIAAKLQEECSEVCHELRKLNKKNLIEELGDLEDVIAATMKMFDITSIDISKAMEDKRLKKGYFIKREAGMAFMMKKGTAK